MTLLVEFFNRGGVLKDTFWSSWPQSLKTLKIALSTAGGLHYFLHRWNLLENARNLTEKLQRPNLFSQLEITRKKFLKTFFWDHLKKIFEDLFLFFLRTPAPVSLVLGLEHPFLFLASRWSALRRAVLGLRFFCVPSLGLKPLSSTPSLFFNTPAPLSMGVGSIFLSGIKTFFAQRD